MDHTEILVCQLQPIFRDDSANVLQILLCMQQQAKITLESKSIQQVVCNRQNLNVFV